MTTSGTTALDMYFAGLFDGEGCVSISLAKASYMAVHVKVAMCDRAPIALLHARFGGRFVDGKHRTRTGRRVFEWSVFNAECVEALEVFSAQCLVKNAVAQAALPVAQSMRANPTRGVLSQAEKAARIEAAKFIASINKPVGPRRTLDETAVAAYMVPKRMGGGKAVRLSDGRMFACMEDAAKALGVTGSAVSFAIRKGTRTRGLLAEVV